MSTATSDGRTGSWPGRLHRGAVRTAAVLLIVGASLIGLHDWPDARTTAPSAATSLQR